MQLSFLGKTYTASTPAVTATETQATVTFLGRSSRVKQFNVTQRQQPAEELNFMGRRYTR
ncbi:hypothetical protein C7293_09650 [filamentous cyanobacterium CCT1]|nr:hypothetical protein C7293_09650 [filamentous cyanobacterium CCT1]PSN81270.1 hypothetical protein C8B47_02110 [filamentous cyanobacterium CCP4]